MNELEPKKILSTDAPDETNILSESDARNSSTDEPGSGTKPDNDIFSSVIALSPLLCGLTIGLFANLIFPPVGLILTMVAPIILWAIWKDKSPRINKIGKNVVNSQISWFIWICIASVISIPLIFILIGALTIWIAPALWLLFTIIHILKVANREDDYVMPLTIRFLK